MGFVEGNKETGESSVEGDKSEGTHDSLSRQPSESSVYATDQEEEDEDGNKIELGPQCTLKEQLEKDKDDESLRKWKEQLLGSVDVNNIGEILEAEVKITSLSIISQGRDDIVLPIPENGKPQGLWFTLKEGSEYSLKFTFEVSNNIVSGLKYTNTVWKTGVKGKFVYWSLVFVLPNLVEGPKVQLSLLCNRKRSMTTSLISVDSSKEMLGTFSPQPEPYTHEMPEETTPSGLFARGQYYDLVSKYIVEPTQKTIPTHKMWVGLVRVDPITRAITTWIKWTR